MRIHDLAQEPVIEVERVEGPAAGGVGVGGVGMGVTLRQVGMCQRAPFGK